MAELDKFKRRLIRAVARQMSLKKDDTELWNELKTETGCDCKMLWKRMRALTIKKLNRLLQVDDRCDHIASIARLTLTDWLLYDLVLVHEKIDFIGMDKLKTSNVEYKPLMELFSLVQRFDIEGKSGSTLAEAWAAATVHYNAAGHQCSPMLLQRRWYQLKEATRNSFYEYWMLYRGNEKRLELANKQKPTRLQTAIAKRYPSIITKDLHDWEVLIEKRLVIMPDEFVSKLRQPNLVKPCDVDDPDLVLVEQPLEIVDVESDTDDLNKTTNNDSKLCDIEPIQSDDVSCTTTESEVDLGITVKKEPLDNYGDAIGTDETAFIDAEDVPPSKRVVHNIIKNVTMGVEIEELQIATEEENILKAVNNFTMVTDARTPLTTETESAIHIPKETDAAVPITMESDAPDFFTEDSDITVEQILPKISSVSGNVSTETEADYDDDLITVSQEPFKVIRKETENIDHEKQSPNSVKCYNLKPSQRLVSTDIDNIIKKKADQYVRELNNEDSKIDNPFDVIPSDIINVDDGIELIDDGIKFIDCDLTEDEKTVEHLKKLKEEEQEDTPKFDLKLLMDPVVYTTKLNDMKLFKGNYMNTSIRNSYIINKVLIESKPVSIRAGITTKVKKETVEQDEIITEEQKVKITSCLLRKPKNRKYNPIQLCKNPDFNTRLKRLTVGFLSSMRNRVQLNACKPITIDIHKTFESKLVHGILYLKSSKYLATEQRVKRNTESNQTTTAVIPSAMPAQSLFENSKLNINDLITASSTSNFFRRKVINLPNIDNVRRLNQQLLTAEVTPIRLGTSNDKSTNDVDHKDPIINNYNSNTIQSELNFTHTQHNSNIIHAEPVLPKIANVETLHDNEMKDTTGCDSNNRVGKNILFHGRGRGRMLPSTHGMKKVVYNTNFSSKDHRPIWCGTSTPLKNDSIKYDFLLPMDTFMKMVTVLEHGKLPENTCKKKKKKCLKNKAEGNENKTTHATSSDTQEGDLTEKHANNPNKIDISSKTMKPKINILTKSRTHGQTTSRRKISEQKFSFEKNEQRVHGNHEFNEAECHKHCEIIKDPNTIEISAIVLSDEEDKEPQSSKVERDSPETIRNPNSEKGEIKTTLNDLTRNDRASCEVTLVNEDVKHNLVKNYKKESSNDMFQNISNTIDSVIQVSNNRQTIIDTIDSVLEKETLNKCNSETNINTEKNIKGCVKPLKIISVRKDVFEKLSETSNQITLVNRETKRSLVSKELISNENIYNEGLQKISNTIDSVIPRSSVIEKETSMICNSKPIIDTSKHIEKRGKLLEFLSVRQDAFTTPSNTKCLETNNKLLLLTDNGNPNMNNVIRNKTPYLITPQESSQSYSSVQPIQKEQHEPVANIVVSYNSKPLIPVSKPKLLIDGTNPCPIRSVMPRFRKIAPKNKVMILNSKHIANYPTESPIYLGKNQILLSTINPKSSESQSEIVPVPPTVISHQAVPDGVQLVMLPSGEIGCSINPGVELDYSHLSMLPTVIAAVQKQFTPSPNDLSVFEEEGSSQKPPVSLADCNTDIIKNTVDIQNDLQLSKSDDRGNISDQPLLTEDRIIENVIPNDIVNYNILDKSQKCNENQDSCNLSNMIQADSSTLTPPREPVTIIDDSEILTNKDNLTNVIPLSEPVIKGGNEFVTNTGIVSNSNVEEADTSQFRNLQFDKQVISENLDDKTDHNVNRKSLLSDLMEMSGISVEDTAPVLETNLFTPNKEISLDISVNDSNTQMGVSNLIVTEPAISVADLDLPELYPVTSLSELKYACKNNGKFFKFHVETGKIVNINVCIKKSQTRKVESVIDLTDDTKDSTDKNISASGRVSKTVLRRRALKKKCTKKGDVSVKPLKLFKAVQLLKNKGPPDTEQIVNESTLKFPKVVRTYRKRKQDLNKIEAKIDLVDSDEPIEEEYLIDSDFEDIIHNRNISHLIKESSDESSDDEPLAKKVRRKAEQLNTEKNLTEHIGQSSPSKNVTATDESNINMEIEDVCLVELPKPFTPNEECDIETSHDDCILGF